MPAYLLAIIDETDPVAFETYRDQALPVVAAFGGRSLLNGTQHERLEGAWAPKRVVVIEFDSMADARAFYDSDAYRGPKALREACARTDMLLFEGRPGAAAGR